ncbi:MAG TPA: hypothetical protein DCG19_15035 [Cryomorphaceae bacterium]|nr:hypothetical protein [Owenweeksia sp.]HAD98725.1 hypothetical protein [Cryomorphaceae bacterium]|tara:strand:- start:9679 stop:11343 length:1665 start_codon:yes stop_codon:yes gene_type:complete
MKNKIYLSLSLLLLLGFTHLPAQKLDVSEIEIELSKDARKAQKKRKSTFTDLGVYWNQDRTELYKIFVYQIKDDPKMYELFIFDETGHLKNSETGEFTANALKKYNLQPAGELLSNEGPDISEQQYGYFRRSTLAGRPTLNIGHFENRYYKGVWYGYRFEEDEDYKLEERFWPDFSFAVQGSSVQNTSSHLLKKRTGLGRILQGERNYIPMDGKVVLGGLMATTEQKTYLTGIYDLQKGIWEVKHENPMESKVNFTGAYLEKDNNQGAYTLLVCEKGYLLLDIGSEGKIRHQTWLPLENTQKNGTPQFWEMQLTDQGGLFLFHPIPGGYTTKKMDLALFEVKDGKVLNQALIPYDEQKEKLVEAPKTKSSYSRIIGFHVDGLEKLSNGNLLIMAHTSSPVITNLIFQVQPDLSLQNIFMIDAVPHTREKTIEDPFAGFLPGQLYPAGNNSYYWITRDIPGKLLPGIHTSTSSSGGKGGPGSIKTVTTTTLRVDEVYAYFKVVKIDLAEGSISKIFYPEKLLSLGAEPAETSKNNNLFINVLGSKSGQYYNLILK